MALATHFVITCEHAGNRIPSRYRPLFRGCAALLHSHRGYDKGAMSMAREMARTLAAPLFATTTSRLLVDLNRSVGHPHLYSEVTRRAPVAVRREILERHYLPYRSRAEAAIAAMLEQDGRVIHISSHSFTPVLDGEVRTADVGLLYDPSRPSEKELCSRWKANLEALAPGLAVRRNYPYTGKSDGFTAYLRRRFSDSVYTGIELEINQKHFIKGGQQWRQVRSAVLSSLHSAPNPKYQYATQHLS